MNDKFKNLPEMKFLWQDCKRWLGLPLSFTKYYLSEDRLFLERGFLNTKSDEVLLYRVRDLSLRISLGQKILGVGTICVSSTDQTIPHLDLINIKYPREVKELIHQQVEKAKEKRRMHSMEIMESGGTDITAADHAGMEEFDE